MRSAQARPELQIGLRTGFCGSLTTFASWVYVLLLQLVGGTLPSWGGSLLNCLVACSQTAVRGAYKSASCRLLDTQYLSGATPYV